MVQTSDIESALDHWSMQTLIEYFTEAKNCYMYERGLQRFLQYAFNWSSFPLILCLDLQGRPPYPGQQIVEQKTFQCLESQFLFPSFFRVELNLSILVYPFSLKATLEFIMWVLKTPYDELVSGENSIRKYFSAHLNHPLASTY